jgi:5'-methylthioadenosine phosphorylase
MKPEPISLAFIGGSGLYDLPGLTDVTELSPETPFGKPSGPIVSGLLEGRRVAFLARHGAGHRLMPSEVPYRANIYALKALGVERLVSISACGSLREDYAPGELVIPDQLFDRTTARARTFFGDGMVSHAGVADPFCPELSASLEQALLQTGAGVHRGGTLLIIEGPRFSTKAESQVYRAWGMSIIGMTAAPEAFLAREAEMCYAVMAHITDYDVWHISEAPVTVEMVVRTLQKNATIAQRALSNLVKGLRQARACGCENAMASALITDRAAVPAETRARLDALVGKYLK